MRRHYNSYLLYAEVYTAKNLVALIESAFGRFNQYVYSEMKKLEFL